MTQNKGVPALPSGHSRAEPEEVSPLRASVPNAIKREHERAVAEKHKLLDALGRVDRRLRQCTAAARLFDIELPPEPNGDPNTVAKLIAVALAAAPNGMTVTEMRPTVEAAYGRLLHQKSIGVALFRMAKKGTARRVGRKWFAQ